MKYRNCPACKKEIEYDSPICSHCNKEVFVVDFGDSAAKLIGSGLFYNRVNAYETCGYELVTTPPGAKPPKEWVCRKYEPKVFFVPD